MPPAPLPDLPAAELAEFDRAWAAARPGLLAALNRRVAPRLAARADADDILARTYLRAVRRWERFRAKPGRSVARWLHRLAVDEVIEAWRRETRGRQDCRRDQALPDRSSAFLGLGLAAAGTTPSEAVAREELCIRMRRALARLRPADRGVLLLRYEEQRSYREIADLLGTTENTATVRCNRALKRLGAAYKPLAAEG